MALNLSAASGELKEFYLPVVREQLNNKVMFLEQIERNADDVEGAEAVLSLHVTRSGGFGARPDGGSLPTPGNQGYTKERTPLRTQTARIRLTVQVIEAMKSDRASWERAVDSEMKRITNDSRRNVNRQLFGTSNGTIATTAVNTGVTTIVLDEDVTKVQARQLEVGMVVDISTAATPGDAAKASARTITAVNTATPSITVSGANITTADDDRVEITGSGSAVGGAGQIELTGLQTIIASTGALFSVDPATYPSWASYKDSNSGTLRTPTENIFEKAMDETTIAGSVTPDLWIGTHGVLRSYSNQLTSLKRFNDTVDLKGGFKGLDISTVSGRGTFTADRDVPLNTAFGVSTDHIKCHQWTDWQWMDSDGAVLSRTTDQLAYEATLFWISELATDQRNAHAIVVDLVEA